MRSRTRCPYFLGAVPRDQAVQRQRLTNARRDLRRAEDDLARARAADEEVEVSLRAMVREAIVAGLLPDEPIEGRTAMLAALQSTLTAAPPPPAGDDVVSPTVANVWSESAASSGSRCGPPASRSPSSTPWTTTSRRYEGVVGQQISRLRSLDLLGDVAAGGGVSGLRS